MPRLLVLSVEPAKTPNQEWIDPYQKRLIEAAITCQGWRVRSADYHPSSIAAVVEAASADLVLNLAYGYEDRWQGILEQQPETAERLETLGCRCIGAPSASQRLAQDKLRTAEFLATHGIRSPRLLEPGRWPEGSDRAVLKPRYGAYHRGVRLVDRQDPQLAVAATSEDWLVQEYIDGPEYTVAVLERPEDGTPEALSPVRIRFRGPSDAPAVMSWSDRRWLFTPDDSAQTILGPVAERIFDLLGFRDYARIDFRLGPEGPVLLDANALPGLHPAMGLVAIAANASGLDYHRLIWRLVQSAGRRYGIAGA